MPERLDPFGVEPGVTLYQLEFAGSGPGQMGQVWLYLPTGEHAPGSLEELAQLTGRAKSNLSRTLKAMEGYGIIRLERGERGRLKPHVLADRVELNVPLTRRSKVARRRRVG